MTEYYGWYEKAFASFTKRSNFHQATNEWYKEHIKDIPGLGDAKTVRACVRVRAAHNA